MNRDELQQLAEDRILDAEALLAAGRWSGAYYLAGYAVECALKSCVLAYIVNTGVIFQEKKYAEKCWTHSLGELMRLADLEKTLGLEIATNADLGLNWGTVRDWTEASRYQQKTQTEAEDLFKAVNDRANGIFPWIKKHY